MYRIVPAKYYLSCFASDRSHMLNLNGNYISEPPAWPPIRQQSDTYTFKQFIDMNHRTDDLASEADFVRIFTS
jgi:hypothetical protein